MIRRGLARNFQGYAPGAAHRNAVHVGPSPSGRRERKGMSQAKPKLAVYWASACGGCEIAFANLGEKLLELSEALDFWFCPCLLDTKRSDVEALADGELAVTLFDGAIRTSENEEWAHLLRRK